MLELRNIVKDYKVGDGLFRAVKDVSLTFKQGEFVAILGPSGCGKTTMLNIIGGLDRYTTGDLLINNTSTKQFKERDWDAYRNNSVGFVFQSYNLINHLSVLDNVELGLTLSGVSVSERKKKAIEVLTKVGLKDQLYKRPTKLSGGEKQRVAIARALVNDPDIILADEPTGALDSKTANEILELIKEVGKDKLVIMVTHAREYAENYATRIVELLDGEVKSNTEISTANINEDNNYKPRKTAMSFFTALKLSFNNLRTKKLRTIITALASSVGIIGVGLVLSISNGFSKEIEALERDQLVGLPILISREEIQVGFDQAGATTYVPDEAGEDEIVVYDPADLVHNNVFTQEFIAHLESMDPEIYNSIHYEFGYFPIALTKISGETEVVDFETVGFSNFIVPTNQIPEFYTLQAGEYPTTIYEVVLIVDEWNIIEEDVMIGLGFDISETITFDDVIGQKLYIGKNDDYYTEQFGVYLPNFNNLDTIADNGVEVTIVGVVQANDNAFEFGNLGIKYLYGLKDEMLTINSTSQICQIQESQNTSVFDLSTLTDDEKEMVLSFLGCNTEDPFLIQIYTDNVSDKEAVKEHIALFNEGRSIDDSIYETDLAEAIGDTLSTLITSISVVLSAFASISLVVSSIMIGVIIYISVLERTKEIGIIRSLGGRRKDISRVFNAESVIIGAFAGLLGVAITFILTFPINAIASNYDESLATVAQVNIVHLVLLVLASTFLTFIGGLIPSRIASRKNPVDALRVE